MNPLKFAYLQCRLYCRMGGFQLLRAGGYDDIQARSIIDNHSSFPFRMTDDDRAFEERKLLRLAERRPNTGDAKSHRPDLKRRTS